ncbi:hypothetical protein [Alicyclobacillus mengziensis]|uniref:Uncharacterized protein n=1 Tax=Alicyclobacillus mengziensis TaxID=2931921 RepID=A0A9X7W1M8_9BACL|nr:hypothetical protein [Alicyclobacillus mengziensis]QSO49091.1 hypothetical protein JZ786_09265 [Alicyclobacillus mengziensis]
MDLSQSSEQWSKSHLVVNELLSQLLNQLRDLGYNPSYHISYDRKEQHLTIDSLLLDKHDSLKQLFDEYVEACNARDAAVEKIQEAPKVDLGF